MTKLFCVYFFWGRIGREQSSYLPHRVQSAWVFCCHWISIDLLSKSQRAWAGKWFDLLSHSVDTSFVTGVELKNVSLETVSVDLFGISLDGRCLACSRRPVKDQIRKGIILCKLVHWLIEHLHVLRMFSWDIKVLSSFGLYFSVHGRCDETCSYILIILAPNKIN